LQSVLRTCWILALWSLSTVAWAAGPPSFTLTVRDSGLFQLKSNELEGGTLCFADRNVASALSACSSSCTTRIAGELSTCKAQEKKPNAKDEKDRIAQCDSVAASNRRTCQLGCSAPASRFSLPAIPAKGAVALSGTIGDNSSSKLLLDLLKLGALWCAEPEKEPVSTPVALAPESSGPVAFPLSTTLGARRSFDSEKRFEWFGWNQPIYGYVLEQQLDREWACSFLPATTPTANACRLIRTTKAGGAGVHLVFEADREVARHSSIEVKTKETTPRHLVTVPISDCTFGVNRDTQAGVGALHLAASVERLELDSSPTCLNQIEAFSTLRMVSGALEPIQATTDVCYEDPQQPGKCRPKRASKDDVRHVFLRVEGVPDNLPLGMQELEVRTARSILGVLRVQVRPRGIQIPVDSGHHPILSVSYESSELDAQHSGKAIDGFAVVTAKEADRFGAVMNAVAPIVDQSLEELGKRLSGGKYSERETCEALWIEYRAAWIDPKDSKKSLDPTQQETFCVAAEFQPQAAVADANVKTSIEACRWLAFESKLDMCQGAADSGVAVLTAEQEQVLQSRRSRRLANDGPPGLESCQALWTKYGAGWADPNDKAKLLDETDADGFCVKTTFVAKSVAVADALAFEACHPVALEEKVDTCLEELQVGTEIFSRDQERLLETHRNGRAWRFSAVSWRPQVWFDEDWLQRGKARLPTPSLLRFAVYQPQVAPFEIDAELRDAYGNVLFRQRLTLASGARGESVPLPLASALHIECGSAEGIWKNPPRHRFSASPPALVSKGVGPTAPANSGNLADDARTRRVVRDLIVNGGVRAVFDEDLDSGGCELVYSPRDMTRFLHRRDLVRARSGDPSTDLPPNSPPKDDSPQPVSEEAIAKLEDCEKEASYGAREGCLKALAEIEDVDPILHLYGAQLIEVKMKRGTEPEQVDVLSIHPGKESRLRLKNIKQRGGDYTVTARLKGPALPSVVYRPGPLQTMATTGSATALPTDLEFQALLRPRGLNGILRNWRIFITFPIRFSGLRFPARSSTLASSNDLTSAQLTGVRLGAMGVLEPWNFDTRQNRGTILPWRFMTGFNLYDLGTGKFDPAYLAGFSVTLPVLELDGSPTARNLSSAIALGAFWEVDLARPHPLKDGNHFLLTFGLDFASLLSE
jgi:hypothetical protein